MTFDELFADFNITQDERKSLVWRLAAMRTQRLIETLLPEPKNPSRKPKQD